MKERGSGWVVNINSSNGLKPSPSTPAYCASKWGVRAWSLSLHDVRPLRRSSLQGQLCCRPASSGASCLPIGGVLACRAVSP